MGTLTLGPGKSSLARSFRGNSAALGSIAGPNGYTKGYNWDNRADWPCSDILLDRSKLLVGKAFEFPAPVAQVDRARDS